MNKTVVGVVKGVGKNGKPYAIIQTVSEPVENNENVKGCTVATEFLPKYLIDKADDYVGHKVVIQYSKFNDKFTVSNVVIVE